jgi:choline dehydrogenase
VGGSSAVNGMIYSRGTKEDYDRWGMLWGEDSQWTWEGLLPYFKKVRNAHDLIGPDETR